MIFSVACHWNLCVCTAHRVLLLVHELDQFYTINAQRKTYVIRIFGFIGDFFPFFQIRCSFDLIATRYPLNEWYVTYSLPFLSQHRHISLSPTNKQTKYISSVAHVFFCLLKNDHLCDRASVHVQFTFFLCVFCFDHSQYFLSFSFSVHPYPFLPLHIIHITDSICHFSPFAPLLFNFWTLFCCLFRTHTHTLTHPVCVIVVHEIHVTLFEARMANIKNYTCKRYVHNPLRDYHVISTVCS